MKMVEGMNTRSCQRMKGKDATVVGVSDSKKMVLHVSCGCAITKKRALELLDEMKKAIDEKGGCIHLIESVGNTDMSNTMLHNERVEDREKESKEEIDRIRKMIKCSGNEVYCFNVGSRSSEHFATYAPCIIGQKLIKNGRIDLTENSPRVM